MLPARIVLCAAFGVLNEDDSAVVWWVTLQLLIDSPCHLAQPCSGHSSLLRAYRHIIE